MHDQNLLFRLPCVLSMAPAMSSGGQNLCKKAIRRTLPRLCEPIEWFMECRLGEHHRVAEHAPPCAAPCSSACRASWTRTRT